MGDGGRVPDRVGADPLEVDRLGAQRPALVQLGQQEEVLDEAAHPGRLLLDPLERLPPAGLVGEAAAAQQLGVPPDGGEGRPQLVRGVRHELAQALLGLRLLGEGSLDPGQHLVQRAAEARHLAPAVLFGHPPGQVARRDGGRRVRHLTEWAQAAPYHGQREHDESQEHGQAGQQLHLAQGGEGVVRLVERERGDHRPLGHGDGHGAVGDRRDRPWPRAPRRRGWGGTSRRNGRRARGERCRHLLHRDVRGDDRCRVGVELGTGRASEHDLTPAVQHHQVDLGRDPTRDGGRLGCSWCAAAKVK